MAKLKTNKEGYIISIAVFFILIIMLGMAVSMGFLISARQKNITNVISSTQSYYAAEAGIEDALLRLKKNPQIESLSFNFPVGNAVTAVVIPSVMGGSRAITASSDNNGLVRSIKATYSIDGQNVSFYYGVEVGEGGLVMNNGSQVIGNVFASGNITGSGTITNDAVVSGNGNIIQGVYVGGNALVYSCLSPANVGNLTYVQGGAKTCTVRGATNIQSEEISQQPMPISQGQIDAWKADAGVNTITGNVTIRNNETLTLGPATITGSLIFQNKASLVMTGTIYVKGNIVLGNTDTIRLDSSYSTLGGLIISDGTINTGNGNTFSGSGQEGSYLLFLSTNTSDEAIAVNNNTTGAVYYTSAGGLKISNNVTVVEATGYKVIMQSNSTIQYSSGVVNIFFSSGTGGSWKVSSWQEW